MFKKNTVIIDLVCFASDLFSLGLCYTDDHKIFYNLNKNYLE